MGTQIQFKELIMEPRFSSDLGNTKSPLAKTAPGFTASMLESPEGEQKLSTDVSELQRQVQKLLKEKNDLVLMLEQKECKIKELDSFVEFYIKEMKGLPKMNDLANQFERSL